MSQMFAFSCENENFNGLTCCMLKNMHSVQLCCQMNFEIAKSCDTPIFLLSFIVGLSFLSFTENIRKYRKEHRGTSEISVTSVTSSLEGSAASSVAFCQSMSIHVNPCQSEGFRRYILYYYVLLSHTWRSLPSL